MVDDRQVSPYLANTYQLILRAFPDEIGNNEYWDLLQILYDHMSDRNLAEVVSLYTGKDCGVVLNDIYKSALTSLSTKDALERTKKILRSAGFEEWLQEE